VLSFAADDKRALRLPGIIFLIDNCLLIVLRTWYLNATVILKGLGFRNIFFCGHRISNLFTIYKCKLLNTQTKLPSFTCHHRGIAKAAVRPPADRASTKRSAKHKSRFHDFKRDKIHLPRFKTNDEAQLFYHVAGFIATINRNG